MPQQVNCPRRLFSWLAIGMMLIPVIACEGAAPGEPVVVEKEAVKEVPIEKVGVEEVVKEVPKVVGAVTPDVKRSTKSVVKKTTQSPAVAVTGPAREDKSGEAFFSHLPAAELCRPDNPATEPLRQFGTPEDAEPDSDLDDDVVSLQVIYENKKGERFRIVARGRDATRVLQFLDQLAVCFEALEISRDRPGGVNPLADMKLIQDQGEPEEEQIFSESVDFSPTILYQLEKDALEPVNVVIEAMLLELPRRVEKGTELAIYYVLDPLINFNEWHGYKAKCQKAAWTDLEASIGKAKEHFIRYRPSWVNIRDLIDEAGDPDPIGVMYVSLSVSEYDVAVVGLQDGSKYAIDGGWTQGYGSACP